VGADFRIETLAAARGSDAGVVDGDLWILGRGDPTLSSERQYTRSLRIPPTKVRGLARAIRDAGVTAVTGGVRGDVGYYAHDWFAPGWKSGYPQEECPLPSALTINGNVNEQGHHISDPEMRAARAVSRRLEKMGIAVSEAPGAGEAPSDLMTVATIASEPLSVLLEPVNKDSANFFAEMLGKRLAVEARGRPGTIAKGAAAIASWANRNGVDITARDSSGLSYTNRVSPLGMARLLGYAEDRPWGPAFRDSLATADEGTLEGRLNGIRVRAKTGTLQEISALSGYVWLRRAETWAEFSILSGGMPKTTAASIEDRIVRTLTRYAR
jgi:D-alanyl-D-alanine carboxypeptidase/D-alanyl-D-alanine-endopeptidase (penicillin-binding protein 4)